MAKNDFSIQFPVDSGTNRNSQFLVAPGTTSSINAGEFVVKALGSGSGKYAAAFTASQALQPQVGTDYLAGFAKSTSTETTTATGYVEVFYLDPATIYYGNPKTPANFGLTSGSLSQATYNAQVGRRVLIDVTAGVHTVLAADGANNGLVVEYQDITTCGGKVAFSLRGGLAYNA